MNPLEMSNKEINPEMAAQFAKKPEEQPRQEKQEIEWVNGKNQYRRMIKFRLFPANSKENKKIGGGFVSGTHWLESNGQSIRYQCPEKTFPESGVVCPVCQMKRELMRQGFTEADLSKDGRFGPENIFNPRIANAVKCVVIETDLKKDWDKSHISILQQNGEAMLRWLVQKYVNPEIPNFTDWTKGAVIKFSRDTDTGKWDREVLPDSVPFNLWNAPAEVVEKVKQQNEEITIAELFRMPTDEQTAEVKIMLESIKAEIVAKKATETAPAQTTTSYAQPEQQNGLAADEIPF